jgi:hypothetical protein
MTGFIEGEDRRERLLLPDCLDDYVAEDNLVREFPSPGGSFTRPFSGSIAKTAFAPELSRSGIRSSDLRRSGFPCLRS